MTRQISHRNFFRLRMMALLIFTGGFMASVAYAHEHKPPHGGTLVEIGEEFAHLELVLDAPTGQLVAYALDGEAENPVRLTQKAVVLKIGPKVFPLHAVASPLTGESVGNTSEFRSDIGAFKGKNRFSGVVKEIDIKGGSFRSVKFDFPSANESAK